MAAAKAAYAEMSVAYAEHRAKIDEIVEQSNEFVAKTEEHSRSLNTWIMGLVFGISGLILAAPFGAIMATVKMLAATSSGTLSRPNHAYEEPLSRLRATKMLRRPRIMQ